MLYINGAINIRQFYKNCRFSVGGAVESACKSVGTESSAWGVRKSCFKSNPIAGMFQGVSEIK